MGKWGMHMELGEESCGIKNTTLKDNITLDFTQKGCENGTWIKTVQDYATSSADQMSEFCFNCPWKFTPVPEIDAKWARH